MNAEDFQYDLPEEAIATHPVSPRSAARLLIFRSADATPSDAHFTDLPSLLRDRKIDQLWVNNTRVIRARLLLRKPTGGRLELFLLEPVDRPMEQALLETQRIVMRCMVRGAKRWSSGTTSMDLPGEWNDLPGTWHLSARVVGEEVGTRLVAFEWSFTETGGGTGTGSETGTGTETGTGSGSGTGGGPTWGDLVEALGAMPLPPYMRRPEETLDEVEYQTVYARHPGSVAAPTAGLHFDHDLWSAIDSSGVSRHEVTLHVGAGTFVPLSEGGVEGHAMHAERCSVSREAISALARPGVRRCVTGTTSLRTLESLFWLAVKWQMEGDRPQLLGQWEAYRDLADHAVKLGWTFPEAMQWLESRFSLSGTDLEDALEFSTAIMMVPGYEVRSADALITNFHLPGSTLLCLVDAFIGSAWRDVYAHALENGYRFLSYGDGSYLEKR